ncbi:MAG: araR [Phycisphaerales bacterium]|nr:araR [Phycisphaerales bacterium]
MVLEEAIQRPDAGTGTPAATLRSARAQARQAGMSYKFQRLREKIRAAITSGELSGKLPGERSLAKRFHANAKTLSKALTDLAAEGVLDRSIGRGTYVKGSEPAAGAPGRWLVISEPGEAESPLVHGLRAVNGDLQVATTAADMRPSFLNNFSAVIDASPSTPETFLRDLLVRNMPLVAVNREPGTYSVHSVLIDVALGVARLGRDLLLAGHRKLAAVEPYGSSAVTSALRQAALRYAPDATVECCDADEIGSLLEGGVSAVVCGSAAIAEKVKACLHKIGVSVPGPISLAAVGCIDQTAPCSGYYCPSRQVAQAVAGLLRDAPAGRPAVLWLSGEWHDLNTTGPIACVNVEEPQGMRVGSMAG